MFSPKRIRSYKHFAVSLCYRGPSSTAAVHSQPGGCIKGPLVWVPQPELSCQQLEEAPSSEKCRGFTLICSTPVYSNHQQ